MAKVMAGIGTGLYGTIDELSFYRMKGVDKTIVRRKGGHTKAKVKKMPKVQRVLSEFSGRSTASKYLRSALSSLTWYAGRNIAGTINALMVPVQEMDTRSDWGQRSIALSTCPHILRGFSLNHTHLFDSVIRHPLQWILNRDTGSAVVHFPELVPGLHLVSPENYPYYSLIITLGVMPDLFWRTEKYMPAEVNYVYGGNAVYSPWYPLLEGSPAVDLTISLSDLPKGDQYSLVLGVGICYGILQGTNHIKLTHNAGSAKVLDVG
jgi:hypothetical protein